MISVIIDDIDKYTNQKQNSRKYYSYFNWTDDLDLTVIIVTGGILLE